MSKSDSDGCGCAVYLIIFLIGGFIGQWCWGYALEIIFGPEAALKWESMFFLWRYLISVLTFKIAIPVAIICLFISFGIDGPLIASAVTFYSLKQLYT